MGNHYRSRLWRVTWSNCRKSGWLLDPGTRWAVSCKNRSYSSLMTLICWWSTMGQTKKRAKLEKCHILSLWRLSSQSNCGIGPSRHIESWFLINLIMFPITVYTKYIINGFKTWFSGKHLKFESSRPETSSFVWSLGIIILSGSVVKYYANPLLVWTTTMMVRLVFAWCVSLGKCRK